MDRSIVVVKVGGSLLSRPSLRPRLLEFLDSPRFSIRRPVLIVGGGAAADAVRKWDRVHLLGERTSHVLALRALELTSRFVEALATDRFVVVETIPECLEPPSGKIPIMALRRFLEELDANDDDPLEHAWSVTSDSIAARLARALRRRIDSSENRRDSLQPCAEPAARLGLVDEAFPRRARNRRSLVAQFEARSIKVVGSFPLFGGGEIGFGAEEVGESKRVVWLIRGGFARFRGVGDPEARAGGFEENVVQIRLHRHGPIHQVPRRFGVERAETGLDSAGQFLVAIARRERHGVFDRDRQARVGLTHGNGVELIPRRLHADRFAGLAVGDHIVILTGSRMIAKDRDRFVKRVGLFKRHADEERHRHAAVMPRAALPSRRSTHARRSFPRRCR